MRKTADAATVCGFLGISLLNYRPRWRNSEFTNMYYGSIATCLVNSNTDKAAIIARSNVLKLCGVQVLSPTPLWLRETRLFPFHSTRRWLVDPIQHIRAKFF